MNLTSFFNLLIIRLFLFIVSIFLFCQIRCDLSSVTGHNDEACIYLSLHCSPKSNKCVSKNFLSLYYEGIKYSFSLDSGIGSSINIPKERIPHTIVIVVTSFPVYKKRRGKVIGLMVAPDALFDCYHLSYIVNDDGVSYHWNIEKIENASRKIPEDALVVLASPESFSIKSFEKSFKPQCPVSLKKTYGVLILPSFVIDVAISNHIDTLDTDYCHAVPSEKKFPSLLHEEDQE